MHCGRVPVRLWAGGAPVRGAEWAFDYTTDCYAGARPLLPARGTPAEVCAVCRQAAAAALATLGDSATHADVRSALRRACDSPHFRSAGRAGELYCRGDFTGACLDLYHADAPALVEALWADWPAAYEHGGLPDAACAAIGRCPPAEWLRSHAHSEAWPGDGAEDDAAARKAAAEAPALLPPPPPPR
jgi:hypothetical protein